MGFWMVRMDTRAGLPVLKGVGIRALTASAVARCLTKEDTEALDMYRRSFAIVTSYLSQEDKQRLAAALEVAFQAHNGQRRRSGEPFVEHPLAVTKSLARLRMDGDTLVAGMLHDTVEDTMLTLDDIQQSRHSNIKCAGG